MRLIKYVLFVLSWEISNASKLCTNPEVKRAQMHIYRTADVQVTVYHCFYSGRFPYSDITKHCRDAFDTGIYIDKWSQEYDIISTKDIKFHKYTTTANILLNEIKLRSGAVCRYDRGFCYDQKETTNFAVVWKVSHDLPAVHAANLVEIFYGFADIWKLRNNSLEYVVYQDTQNDRSFGLQMVKKNTYHDKDFWYTDRYGIIVSKANLKNVQPVPRLDQAYFPLKSKRIVSERILKSCDIQNFPLDFERNINENYGLDQNDFVNILNIFQKQLIDTKNKLAAIPDNNGGDLQNNKVIVDLQEDMRDVETSLLDKEGKIADIRNSIKNILNSLSNKDLGVSKLEERIKQILANQQSTDAKCDKITEKMLALQKQFSSLINAFGDTDTDKQVADLEKQLAQLETLVLNRYKEIFTALTDKDKDMKEVKESLNFVYDELQNRTNMLKIEQESNTNQLFDLEMELNRQNNEIIKCHNDTTLILSRHQTFVGVREDRDNLAQKYNSVLDKLNTHDNEISKCRNDTQFILLNNNKWLGTIEKQMKSIVFGSGLKLEGQIRNLQNRDIVIETSIYDRDRLFVKLRENITRSHEEFIYMLKDNNVDIRTIKEKTEQCRKDINRILSSNGEGPADIQKNLSDVQNILSQQGRDIMMLLGLLNEVNNKLDEDNEGDEINEVKNYVNERLKTKDEEINHIHGILIKKDMEFKTFLEKFKQVEEECTDCQARIKRCQADTDEKLKEKDKQLKRIRDDLTIKDRKFDTELKKRDEEYKKLENKLKHLENSIGLNVDPV